jgi:hypothetical protein
MRLVTHPERLVSRLHVAGIVNFEDVDVQPLTHPGRNSQGGIKRGSRYHDCVSRAGTWVLHPPRQLTVRGVDIKTDRGGAPLGLGVKLLLSALGVDVYELDLA